MQTRESDANGWQLLRIYAYTNDNDAKLNFDDTNFAIKRNIASCETEITLKLNSGTRVIM